MIHGEPHSYAGYLIFSDLDDVFLLFCGSPSHLFPFTLLTPHSGGLCTCPQSALTLAPSLPPTWLDGLGPAPVDHSQVSAKYPSFLTLQLFLYTCLCQECYVLTPL